MQHPTPNPSLHPPIPPSLASRVGDGETGAYIIHDLSIISSSKIRKKVCAVLRLLYPDYDSISIKSHNEDQIGDEADTNEVQTSDTNAPVGSRPHTASDKDPSSSITIQSSASIPSSLKVHPKSQGVTTPNQVQKAKTIKALNTNGTSQPIDETQIKPSKQPIVRISAKSGVASKLITVVEIVKREALALSSPKASTGEPKNTASRAKEDGRDEVVIEVVRGNEVNAPNGGNGSGLYQYTTLRGVLFSPPPPPSHLHHKSVEPKPTSKSKPKDENDRSSNPSAMETSTTHTHANANANANANASEPADEEVNAKSDGKKRKRTNTTTTTDSPAGTRPSSSTVTVSRESKRIRTSNDKDEDEGEVSNREEDDEEDEDEREEEEEEEDESFTSLPSKHTRSKQQRNRFDQQDREEDDDDDERQRKEELKTGKRREKRMQVQVQVQKVTRPTPVLTIYLSRTPLPGLELD